MPYGYQPLQNGALGMGNVFAPYHTPYQFHAGPTHIDSSCSATASTIGPATRQMLLFPPLLVLYLSGQSARGAAATNYLPRSQHKSSLFEGRKQFDGLSVCIQRDRDPEKCCKEFEELVEAKSPDLEQAILHQRRSLRAELDP